MFDTFTFNEPDKVTDAANKIMEGGTPFFGRSPCQSCAYYQYIKGYRNTEQINLCSGYDHEKAVPLPWLVAECTIYQSKAFVDLDTLKRNAWKLVIIEQNVVGIETDGKETLYKFLPAGKEE